ncbi:MAG TPA: MBL fold metallo-hydrolase [Sphingomicrobium sp.]|nr:MBL fold metallo-hydrolase [Sphingomicrobium sp.]
MRADRSKPATLLIVDGRYYLFDCGTGTMQRMLQAGIDSQQIQTIFLTHLHSDHDLGLVPVLANDYFLLNLKGATQTISIYGPPQTKELVDAAFRFITISVRPFAAENPDTYRTSNGHFVSPFQSHEFARGGLIFQDDKIRVVAAENSHYALMTGQQRRTFQSYSYRVDTPHGTVVFTGDTGPSEAVERLAKDADVLVAEADALNAATRDQFVKGMSARSHWSPMRTQEFRAHFISEHLDTNEIGQLAAGAQVRSVILYHYGPDDPPPHASYVEGVRKYFNGPVFAPDDLDLYCLSDHVVRECKH